MGSMDANNKMWRVALPCATCGAAECAPAPQEPAAGQAVQTWMVARNMPLFLAGDPVHDCVYFVRSGSFKLCSPPSDGVRHVTAFPMAGEFIGLCPANQSHYDCDALALENSLVCAVPRDRVRAGLPGFLAALSQALAQEQALSHLLRQDASERRLAGFLLGMGNHQTQRGYSDTVLRLPMSWRDVASYLGMSPACLSRSLLRLRHAGTLSIEGKRVHLSDVPALRALAFMLEAPAPAGSRRPSDQMGPAHVH